MEADVCSTSEPWCQPVRAERRHHYAQTGGRCGSSIGRRCAEDAKQRERETSLFRVRLHAEVQRGVRGGGDEPPPSIQRTQELEASRLPKHPLSRTQRSSRPAEPENQGSRRRAVRRSRSRSPLLPDRATTGTVGSAGVLHGDRSELPRIIEKRYLPTHSIPLLNQVGPG
jgi:hypothetical protein